MNDFIPYISTSINDTVRSLSFFYPEVILVIGFVIVILADLFFSKRSRHAPFLLAIVTLVITALLNYKML